MGQVISMVHACTVAVVAPLVGSVASAVAGKRWGNRFAHGVTITGVLFAWLASLVLAHHALLEHGNALDWNVYTWLSVGSFHVHVGFLCDALSALMAVVVTTVSLLVHVYSIGYMHDDPGYARFFAYVSLFTFAMLMLVLGNNALQMFFGWEGVGAVSYLLIGFWFHKPSAAAGSLKAFLVNRVGDFGFILGVAGLLSLTGGLDYATLLKHPEAWSHTLWSFGPLGSARAMDVVGLLLFVGAMGKSAQIPLHVWLPESMEGPTPISALIHAATMVTAGIYMMTRFAPWFDAAPVAQTVVLWVGSTGAFALGLVGGVQHDIKRVVAYSTLSQLGYMVAGVGASAYAASMFHLVTHACFKALLFLAAGSVIHAMHHEQDMRKMGQLWSRLPVTYATFLLGSLALIALPPFAGFYSKDAIIEAVAASSLPGARYALTCLVLGACVTAFYTVRALLMTFHGPRQADGWDHVHESPWSMRFPLIALAVPSVVLGAVIAPAMLGAQGWFPQLLTDVPPSLRALALQEASHPWAFAWDGLVHAPFWMGVLGMAMAWLAYQRCPGMPKVAAERYAWLHRILLAKFGFDAFNEAVAVRGTLGLGRWLHRWGDQRVIDGTLVMGFARLVGRFARRCRPLQSGLLYHYALVMVLGLLGLVVWATT